MKSILLSCIVAVGMVALPVTTSSAKVSKPYPMEYWAAPAFMSNLEVSPDGKYVAFRKAQSQKGNYIIEIYETGNMSKEPKRVGAASMDLRSFSWVGNSEMIVSFRDQVSKRIKGFNQGAYKSRLALFSVHSGDFSELNSDDFNISLVNGLINEPNHVLVRFVAAPDRNSGFRAPSFFRYNLKTGSKQLVLKGNEDMTGYRFDPEGNPRFAVDISDPDETIYLYRPVGGSGWKEYYRRSIESPESFNYGGLVDDDPNRIYIIAHNGEDRAGLWKFNLTTQSFEDLVFRHDKVELRQTIRHSNPYTNPSKVTGVLYGTDKWHREWFDAEEEAIIKQFEAVIPNAHYVNITSRSKGGDVLVIQNRGPRDPGSFYLFNKGQFSAMGSVNGLLKAEGLSDVKYIDWTARDGKTINGYLTVPKGKGPHPLIVMPHGGPFVSEVIMYDDWGQMLANNGYMVLQPQYRGSTNYGLDFYKAAFINGGEGGKKMQDDKDDGVLHLIKEGLVDKDRVAMFGWSYGGYAALIAATRSPNLYQCVISGAPVADNLQQVNYYRNRLDGWQETEQVRFWDDSINPIKVVNQVNVPMLLIHGSIDQRVPVRHAEKYVKALEDAGKDFEYIKLKNADHFSDTLKYDHKMKAYPRMISFLKNDCGSGGL